MCVYETCVCVNVWHGLCAGKATTVLCSYAHITPRANTIINSAFLNVIIILLLIIIIDTIMDIGQPYVTL